jgi:hypothetical protein
MESFSEFGHRLPKKFVPSAIAKEILFPALSISFFPVKSIDSNI